MHHHLGAQRRVHSPTLAVEPLEARCLLSGGPPAAVPIGPPPAATAGLTENQIRRADVVIDWNATLIQALHNAATPPTVASRALALVGVAVYDAVDAVRPTYELYPLPGFNPRPPHDASAEAAAIGAAYRVLSALFPAQQAMFTAELQATLGTLPGNKPTADGFAFGQSVADAVLAWRANDGSAKVVSYTPGTAPGDYQLTPPGFQSPLSPQWPGVTPWAMTSGSQFRPPPPPALTSAEYAADFNQVKALGGATSAVRTPEQTLIAHFWADVPGHSPSPPGHWDEIAEHLGMQFNLSLADNARLFALVNIALADAGLACWDAKYHYDFWRPITAIQNAGSDGNPLTTPDTTWTPLWTTPSFQSYTSGHSTFSGAASTVLASLFGDRTRFTIGTDDMPGVTRTFTSFSQAADEAGMSRIYGGIHFMFDNLAGLTCGRALGNYLTDHFLRPLRGPGHDHGDGDDGPTALMGRSTQPSLTSLIVAAGSGQQTGHIPGTPSTSDAHEPRDSGAGTLFGADGAGAHGDDPLAVHLSSL
jgi:membrane-associated phospholipid phosphatase